MAEASPSDSGGQPQLLLDNTPPEVTTTTVAPTTTTVDPGPALEARKAPLVATAGEQTTTTLEPTTTVAPATTAAPVAETEIAGTDEAGNAEASTTSVTEGAEAVAVDETTADGAPVTTVVDGTETTVTTVEETTTTTTEATTTTETVPASTDEAWVDAGNGVALPAVMLDIRYCESRGDYLAANSRSTARGAFQFLTGSWKHYGHAERYGVAQAHLATPAQQDEAALKTWQADGTRPWNASKSCWSKNPVA